MEKPDFLKTRVSTKLKSEFEEICQALAKQPGVQLRELVAAFVKQNYGQLHDRVVVHIHRPDNYQVGAWRVIVKLRDPSELTRSGMSVTFPLPDLPGRLLVIDPEYRVAVVPNSGDPVLGAQFVKGELRANLYSNGIPEADNRTSIDTVREVLTSTVLSLIERFNPADQELDGTPLSNRQISASDAARAPA